MTEEERDKKRAGPQTRPFYQTYAAFLRCSATHNFINDCRGTPRRWASLSSCLTIQGGKSTLS